MGEFVRFTIKKPLTGHSSKPISFHYGHLIRLLTLEFQSLRFLPQQAEQRVPGSLHT